MDRQRLNDVERILRFGFLRTSEVGSTEYESSQPLLGKFDQLPRFGQLGRYGIDESQEEKLWTFEIKRLMKAKDGKDASALVPRLQQKDCLLYSSINQESWKSMRSLAGKLLCSLYISVLDDELCDLTSEAPDTETISKASSYLRRSLGQMPNLPAQTGGHYYDEEVGENGKICNRASDTILRQPIVASATTGADQHLADDKSDIDQYHHFVNHVTSTLALLAVRSHRSSSWELVVLACLAKISTKMKVLAGGLLNGIQTCFNANEITKLGVSSKESRVERDLSIDPFVVRYCKQHKDVSAWLCSCIEHVLWSMDAEIPLNTRGDDFNLSALVYEAGSFATRTLIYQNRWGGIGGSAGVTDLSWASRSMDCALMMAEGIRHMGTSSTRCEPPRAKATTVPFKASFRAEGERAITGGFERFDTGSVDIRNLLHLVCLVTPLCFVSPSLATGLASSLKTVSALSAFGDCHSTEDTTIAKGFFRLDIQKPNPDHRASLPPETPSISKSILAKRWDPRHDVGYLNKQWHSLQSEKDRLESLTIQERSIKVGCPRYVYKVFLCTATIVLGGLVSSFLVGDRIPAVDPFNLAMYSWIIGGLMLLIAKVRHVSEWTWREFFLTEVACRSVSEVASLSKLDEQQILLHLLSKEPNSILRTGGPYQGCFEKDSDGDGFSIDVKPKLETLVNAGIVPVKVLTLEGTAIVFLRLVYGSQGFKTLELVGKASEVDVCFVPPTKDDRLRRVIVRKEVSWTSILGLYETPGVVFG